MAASNSNTKLLEELEALSQSLYQSHTSTTRRAASLALPRTSVPSITSIDETKDEERLNAKPRSRRLSLSPWRSRPKLGDENEQTRTVSNQKEIKTLDEKADTTRKKGLWNWKPIRVLSHIGMQKLSCLFSVEVVAVQGLPASMNGLRLAVCVRKAETKDGAVHTMPSRVLEGAADFEETLFARCHVYFNATHGKQLKFEPRPFLIYVFATDAKELDFGRSSVDLSHLIQESIDKSFEGARVRQWDVKFNLSGKAKEGELILKLGFQIMEKDGGTDIYGQAQGLQAGTSANLSSSSARRQSKSSFSIQSPRLKSRAEARTPAQEGATAGLQGIDELNLDEPAPSVQKSEEPESHTEDLDLPDFEVVDKGVEFLDEVKEGRKEDVKERSVSTEVVKTVVHDHIHLTRLTELDSIAQQIKALESMMREEKGIKMDEDVESQRLDEDEETVTREFLQMLEDAEASKEVELKQNDIPPMKQDGSGDSAEAESKVFIPDLGKGLGCVVQTRHGGYLSSMNPLDTTVARKDTPKLAMQISKPVVLPTQNLLSGFELIQMMTALGQEELSDKILSLMPMDDLMGKTAEQIAFEGIASAIIHGRNKEGADSSAARTIAAVKKMATAMSMGRKDRISTGLWNVNEDLLATDEILAFSLQKIEAAVVEALKIQADMAEEEAPFDISSYGNTVTGNMKEPNKTLFSAISLEDWIKNSDLSMSNGESSDPERSITLSVVVQLRDPLRRYETVGGPMIILIQAMDPEVKPKTDDEKRFKVASLHVGGIKTKSGDKRSVWDTDKHRLTAMQWLVAYGLGKVGRKEKHMKPKGPDLFWSISSRIMADMWLKPIRNPDVKFPSA